MRFIKSIITLLIILLLVGTAQAADYYISTDGLDTNVGNLSQPWGNLSKCATDMVAGDTCWVINGTYNNQPTANYISSGTAENPIIIKTYNGTPRFIHNTSAWFFKVVTQSYIELRGPFYHEGGSATGNVIVVFNSSHIYIGNLTINGTASDAMNIEASNNLLIENNDIAKQYLATGHSIAIYGYDYSKGDYPNQAPNENITIRNNTIHNFYTHNGIDIHSGVNNTLIEGNTFYDGNQRAIWYHQGYTGGKLNYNGIVRNNIFRDAQSASGIFISNGYNITVTNNTFSNYSTINDGYCIRSGWWVDSGDPGDKGTVIDVNVSYNTISDCFKSIVVYSQNITNFPIGNVTLLKNTVLNSAAYPGRGYISLPTTATSILIQDTNLNVSGDYIVKDISLIPYILKYNNTMYRLGVDGNVQQTVTYYPNGTSFNILSNDNSQTYTLNLSSIPNNQVVTSYINSYTPNVTSNLVTFIATSTDGNLVNYSMWNLDTNYYYNVTVNGSVVNQTLNSGSTGSVAWSNSTWNGAKTISVVRGDAAPTGIDITRLYQGMINTIYSNKTIKHSSSESSEVPSALNMVVS